MNENAVRRYQRALLRVWDTADEDTRAYGAQWYGAAHARVAELAERYSFTTAQAAGVIAALSPRVRWDENVADADYLLSVLEDERDGLPVPDMVARRQSMRAFLDNVETACKVAGSDDPLAVLRGPKQRAFYRNIMGDADGVTVDVWATRAATRGALNHPRNAGEYATIAAAYRRAARAVGVTPRDFQAAAWVAVRGAAE
jgi:hypothetical protein